MSQDQKCVILTGGSRGLGLATIRQLLAEGYAVATCSRQNTDALAALIAERGDRALLWHPCAVGDEAQETAFFAAALEWVGDRRFYGLVNNAAVARDGILATLPNVDSARILEVNLLGSLRMARLALRRLLATPGGGRIINISSIIGSRGYVGLAAYSASKAGLDGLTRALAREVGRRQITVNSVAPGYLETEMSAGLEQRQRSQIVNRTPLARLGTVDDVVPMISFLLGDGARFITGQTLTIDGGISC